MTAIIKMCTQNAIRDVSTFLNYMAEYYPEKTMGSYIFHREKPRLEKEINMAIRRYWLAKDFWEQLSRRYNTSANRKEEREEESEDEWQDAQPRDSDSKIIAAAEEYESDYNGVETVVTKNFIETEHDYGTHKVLGYVFAAVRLDAVLGWLKDIRRKKFKSIIWYA